MGRFGTWRKEKKKSKFSQFTERISKRKQAAKFERELESRKTESKKREK